MKFGVSGCTRECSEAQGKDVGIIATDKGWNLYFGGNGGMKPRHGDLFASDLDEETLVHYIDRFMMFYIRTADKLQRTSVWLDNLEGGIEYLRDVIINDKLGLNAQLEKELNALQERVACEWKETVDSPKALKRFAHFINNPMPDPTVQTVKERFQHRPARLHERIDIKLITEEAQS
jgi:nitrite reductase (NADH) large subunit